MPIGKLREFLDANHVKYVTIKHSIAYTAPEVAASAHIPGKEVAKTVIVKVDGTLAMAVLPSSFHVDLGALEKTLGAKSVTLASEAEFKGLFPECQAGAMPPFGNLYGMELFVAESLREDEEIAFNACTHTELIRMSYGDFERLAKPKIMRFSAKSPA